MTITQTAPQTTSELLSGHNLKFRQEETDRITRAIIRPITPVNSYNADLHDLPRGVEVYTALANLSKSARIRGQFPHHKAIRTNRGLTFKVKEWFYNRKSDHKYTNLRAPLFQMTMAESDSSVEMITFQMSMIGSEHAAKMIHEIINYVTFSYNSGKVEAPESLVPLSIHNEVSMW